MMAIRQFGTETTSSEIYILNGLKITFSRTQNIIDVFYNIPESLDSLISKIKK